MKLLHCGAFIFLIVFVVEIVILAEGVCSASASSSALTANADGVDADYEDYEETTKKGRASYGRGGSSMCPPMTLVNGRVRLRSRGRIAKFMCRIGFQELGKRFATCIRGHWNARPPICISRGCPTFASPANGRMSLEYRGALLNFACNPGFALVGSRTLYCDGKEWNSTAPNCEVAVKNPQRSCDFEREDLCGWSQGASHDFDWKRFNFVTPSGHVGTGPSHDHTLGAGRDGFYMYIEASSPRVENDTARLFSPVYSDGLTQNACFRFWYHMYGATTGQIRVYVKPVSKDFSSLSPKFVVSGDQGNKWIKGLVHITRVNEPFQVVVEGVRGSSYVSDSAIDDVELTTESECMTADGFSVTSLLMTSTQAPSRTTSDQPINYVTQTNDEPEQTSPTTSFPIDPSDAVTVSPSPPDDSSSVTADVVANTTTQSSRSRTDSIGTVMDDRPYSWYTQRDIVTSTAPTSSSKTNAPQISSTKSITLKPNFPSTWPSSTTSVPMSSPTFLSRPTTATTRPSTTTRPSKMTTTKKSAITSSRPIRPTWTATPTATARPTITSRIPASRDVNMTSTWTTSRNGTSIIPSRWTTMGTTKTPTTTPTETPTASSKTITRAGTTNVTVTSNTLSTLLSSSFTPSSTEILDVSKITEDPEAADVPILINATLTTFNNNSSDEAQVVDMTTSMTPHEIPIKEMTMATTLSNDQSNVVEVFPADVDETDMGEVPDKNKNKDKDQKRPPPWTYMKRQPSKKKTTASDEDNELDDGFGKYVVSAARTARDQVSVPTVVGLVTVGLLSMVIVAVVARKFYSSRSSNYGRYGGRRHQDVLSEDSDVRYLKDGEVPVEFSDLHARFLSGKDMESDTL